MRIKSDLLFAVVAVFVLVGIIITSGSAQLFTPGGDRSLLPGARAVGLGDAYTADRSDVSAMYWNPASVALMENISMVVDHYIETGSGMSNELATGAIPNIAGGVIAIGWNISHIGYPNPQQPGNYQALAYGFDIGYASELDAGFSLGGRFHGEYGRSEAGNFTVNYWTLGLMYNPSPDISYGIVYGGIGEGLFVVNAKSIRPVALQRSLELGIAMRYPSGLDRRILGLSLSNQKLFGETGLIYKAGLELLPVRFLALRYGYVLGLDQKGPRFGLGVITRLLRVDYGIAPNPGDLRFQEISLALNI